MRLRDYKNYTVGVCNLLNRNISLVTVRARSQVGAMTSAVLATYYNENLNRHHIEFEVRYNTVEKMRHYMKDYWNLAVSKPTLM